LDDYKKAKTVINYFEALMKNKIWPIGSLVLNGILVITLIVGGINLLHSNADLYEKTAALHVTKINNGILMQRLQVYEDMMKKNVKHVKKTMQVSVTMYQALKGQTDDRPNETADGTIIKVRNASNYRFVAVSRNLHQRWGGNFKFGDYIYLSAIRKGKQGQVIADKSGFYQIRDIMNKRFIDRIDILESPDVKPYKFEIASLRKIEMDNVE